MSYLGLNPDSPLLNASTQFFSGNGAVTQYTLGRAVASASDLDVIVGNTAQVPFVDYVAGNTTIIFTVAPGLGTDNVAVTYRAGALNSLDLSASVFQAGTVGAPSVYSLASNNAGIYWASANTVGIVVTGANRALFNANSTSVNSVTGAIVTPGGIGVGGNIHIGNQATVNGGIESTSVSTGTLRVTGGTGITGNLNVGGDITCVGDFTVNGTFTTTGTESLEVTDPFIFLANANPGDTFDTGVVSQFFDGLNNRYTGYFRDITDNQYKFFGNLLTKPGTTVDVTDPSYRAANLVVGNLSATGNVSATYLLGNGALLSGISVSTSEIFLGNTRVTIPSINGNIINNVNGVTIANVWSGGLSVVGAINASTTIVATGNITAGNIDTAGQITATGNITSAANVSGGNILTGGRVVATGNVVGGNILGGASGVVSTGGNVIGGNIRTAGIVSASGDIYGLAINATTAVSAGTTVAATTDITAGGTISATGDISSGGQVNAVGNVVGVYFNGTGISLTGNVISNLRASLNATVAGNITGGNVLTGGLMSATGNVTGGNLITGALAQAATLSVTGGATFSTTTAEIGIGNSMTSGVIYVGGPSQTGVMIVGQSTVTQTVNLATGATGSASTKTLNLGTNGAANSQTNINIGTSAGNAAVSFTANTTVAVANTGGSALSVAGNITGGNAITGGLITAAGNITGSNLNTGGQMLSTGNITGGNINTGGLVTATGNVNTGSGVLATGNVTGGNINTGGLISATGNITAAGNVAAGNVITRQLISNVSTGTAPLSVSSTTVVTNLNADLLDGYNSSIANAATSVTVRDSAGNIAGNVFTGVGVSVTGNITGGNVLGGANVNATTHTGTTVSVTGNIDGGNLRTAGLVSATGNVLGGNIIQGGVRVMKWTTQGTTPSNAVAGDFWYEPTSDKLYQYWNDGTSNVWVDQSQATTLSTLSVSGNATISGTLNAANLTVSSGVWSVTGITNAGANGAGNIGNAAVTFNTVFAKATTAQYADLAENYLADAVYAPGTVLVFGGTAEVTVSNISHDTRIAGVVSTQPAYLMNSHQANGTPVALMGRVPCQVRGPVNKGDRLVNIAAGIAGRYDSGLAQSGCIIGKSLQDIDSDRVDIIEIVVGKT
jgi:hypothetical protein